MEPLSRSWRIERFLQLFDFAKDGLEPWVKSTTEGVDETSLLRLQQLLTDQKWTDRSELESVLVSSGCTTGDVQFYMFSECVTWLRGYLDNFTEEVETQTEAMKPETVISAANIFSVAVTYLKEVRLKDS